MPLRFRPLGLSRHFRRPVGRFYSSDRVIKEHDVIVMRQRGDREPKFHLTPPLRKDTTVRLSYGATVNASDVIGKAFTDRIQDSGGRDVRLHEVSLAQYVTNSSRVATPIYPQDANLIVSLLDFSLPNPGEDPASDDGPPFEVFEAGTGMGALTLHLVRAMHGANPPVPPRLREALCTADYERNTLPLKVVSQDEDDAQNDFTSSPPHALQFPDAEVAALHEKHVASRRAILHTLDVNPTTSRMAHGLVRQFRRGQYLLDVDFHVRTIRSYLSSRLAGNGGRPFLAHALLDLPASEDHADVVVEALVPGGKLVVFCPSITQILDMVKWVDAAKQPLALDRVVELQTSTSNGEEAFRDGLGGRHWDVRKVTIRKAVRDGKEGDAAKGFVCRPKVGTRVIGGGFVAVFDKLPRRAASAVQQTTPGVADEQLESEQELESELEPESEAQNDTVEDSLERPQ